MQQYIVRVSALYWNDSQSICEQQCSTQMQNATLRSSCDLFAEHCGGYINNKLEATLDVTIYSQRKYGLRHLDQNQYHVSKFPAANMCYGHHGGYLWVAIWNCNYRIWLEMLAILFRSIYISCRAHKVTMMDLWLKNVEKHGLRRLFESLCGGFLRASAKPL